MDRLICSLWALGSAYITCLETQAIPTAGAEIHSAGGNSRNSTPHKRRRRILGSDGRPKERMLLIKQYEAQVLQLMLIRPSQTSRVMQAGLLEDIFDDGFSLESGGERGISDFCPGCQGCKGGCQVPLSKALDKSLFSSSAHHCRLLCSVGENMSCSSGLAPHLYPAMGHSSVQVSLLPLQSGCWNLHPFIICIYGLICILLHFNRRMFLQAALGELAKHLTAPSASSPEV